jgi:hypothetical protein
VAGDVEQLCNWTLCEEITVEMKMNFALSNTVMPKNQSHEEISGI